MRTVTRVWSALETYVQALSFLLALLCVFTVAAPQAQAATPSFFQQQLVTALLSFFGTDSAKIDQVAAVLTTQGTPATPSSLVVSTDASNPPYTVSVGGTANVVLGIYKLRATGEDIRVTKVVISLGGSSTPSDVTELRLSDAQGNVLASSVSGANQYVYFTLATPLLVPKDSEVSVVLRGDIAPIGVNQARSGDFIVPTVQSETFGVGVTTGATINAIGGTPASGVRLFSTHPMVSKDLLPHKGVTDGRLLRFKITATNSGSLTIGRLGFSVIAPFANVSDLALHAYTDSSYSAMLPVPSGDGKVGTLSNISGNVFAMIADEPLIISAGNTVYFELRASVVPTTQRITVVGTSLLGDTVFAGPGTRDQISPGRLVWSPSANPSLSATSTDWFNGYGIPGLATTGFTQSRYGSIKTITMNDEDLDTTTLVAALPYASQTLLSKSQLSGSVPFRNLPVYMATSTLESVHSEPIPLPRAPVATTSPTSSPVTYTLAVSPTSGKAPLSVQAVINVQRSSQVRAANSSFCETGAISWGDGSPIHTARIQCTGSTDANLSHTYVKSGTYTVKFYKQGNTPCSGMVCAAGTVMPQPVATAEVTVTAGEVAKGNPPTCTVTANKTSVSKGQTVVLSWTSENATRASTADGGKLGKPQGSAKVRPTEDTTYIKKVYGPGGEGVCTITIEVSGDEEGTPLQKLTWNMPPVLAQTLYDMQAGAVVLAEDYQSLFR